MQRQLRRQGRRVLMGVRLRAAAAMALLVATGCSGSESVGGPDAAAVEDASKDAADGTVGSGSMDATMDGSSTDGSPEVSRTDDEASFPGVDAEAGIDGTVGASDAGDAQPSGVLLDACPAPLSAATASALQGGGTVDPAMSWLYPYSGTVFPAGIPAPILQWTPQSGAASAALLHLHSRLFDYQGCFAPTNPGQLAVPTTAWATAAAQSLGASDPLTVELTTSVGSVVSGPITETWILASGPLAGNLYYDTYGSHLVPGQSAVGNGAVMKLVPGAAQPTAFLYTDGGASPFGPCITCHAVAANGSLFAAEEEFYPSSDPLYGKGSESFALSSASPPDPLAPLASTLNDSWGLSAVYPDGTLLLTSGEPGDSTTTPLFPGAAGNNPGMIGPKKTAMYATATGNSVAFTGLSAQYAMMPMFSPDGTHVVYNDYDAGSGHTLTVMAFSASSKTFSNATTVFHDATLYPGWPAFTPDGQWVIFALGNSNNYRDRGAACSVSDLLVAALHRQRSGGNGAAARRPERLQRGADVPARRQRGREPRFLSEREPRRIRGVLLGLFHQPPLVRESLQQGLGRRREQGHLGGGRRHRGGRRAGPEPPGVLHARAGARERQLPGDLRARPLQGGRLGVR